jgi:hypothetical protein
MSNTTKRRRGQNREDLSTGSSQQEGGSPGALRSANTELQRRISEAELHRHLLIETLHGLSGASVEASLFTSGGQKGEGDLPPGPWHKGGDTGGEASGGNLPPGPGHQGAGIAANADLQDKLAEAEQHRHLLIKALHGLVKQTATARFFAIGQTLPTTISKE